MAARLAAELKTAGACAMKSSVVNLLTAPFCAAWVLYSPFAEPYSKDQTRWLNPSSFDLAEQVALGPADRRLRTAARGGIAWALSPNFCENLLPMFPEEPFGNDADASDYASENPGLKFITCHELHDAIARAFNTWSNNNKMIKFTDVTEQCKDDPDVNEGSCAYAEFVIMPDLAYAEEKGLAAYVEMRMVRQSAPAVHTTSGAAMSQAIVVRPSTMHVRATGICWYLDTTFCYQIFRWQNVGGLDVITLMRAVVSFLVIAAVGMLTWVLDPARPRRLLPQGGGDQADELRRGVARPADRGRHDVPLARAVRGGPLTTWRRCRWGCCCSRSSSSSSRRSSTSRCSSRAGTATTSRRRSPTRSATSSASSTPTSSPTPTSALSTRRPPSATPSRSARPASSRRAA